MSEKELDRSFNLLIVCWIILTAMSGFMVYALLPTGHVSCVVTSTHYSSFLANHPNGAVDCNGTIYNDLVTFTRCDIRVGDHVTVEFHKLFSMYISEDSNC